MSHEFVHQFIIPVCITECSGAGDLRWAPDGDLLGARSLVTFCKAECQTGLCFRMYVDVSTHVTSYPLNVQSTSYIGS